MQPENHRIIDKILFEKDPEKEEEYWKELAECIAKTLNRESPIKPGEDLEMRNLMIETLTKSGIISLKEYAKQRKRELNTD